MMGRRERRTAAMEMSNYCKAYLVRQLRQFPGWTENQANVRKETREIDGKEVEVERRLDDESHLYLHDSYVVTDGIYKDENVIFDVVTDDWKRFCHETLEFEIPVDEPIEIPPAAEGAVADGAETADPPASTSG
jgi:hypothetical protein